MVAELKSPLPDEVARMVATLSEMCWDECDSAADMIERLARQLQEVKDWNAMLADHNEQLAQRGDDLEERLARQVPEGCVVVPSEPTEAMVIAGNLMSHGVRAAYKAMIAAGEVKP